jgi:2,7-dihydroxy-5-methyl-1-naphthoate 7-O-methyltransferase
MTALEQDVRPGEPEDERAGSAWRDLQPLMDLTTPWAVRVVATLRVPDLIAAGVTQLESLAQRCSADAGALGRVLRYLAARGVFEEPEPGIFTLTPTGRLLEDRMGVRAWLDQDGFGGRMDRAWPALLETVRTGKPGYADVFGLPLWEDLEANPRISQSFNDLMAAQSEDLWPDLAGSYNWSTVREVVDVGGGTGTLLVLLARAHPHLRGTVLDLPATARAAAERFAREGLADRCRSLAGSMFDPLPPGADVYLLSMVIGDWEDGKAAAILQRCAEAAGSGGRVLVMESLLENDAASSSAMDLLMLVLTDGGRSRTIEQFREILGAAGLELVRCNAMPSGRCLLECAALADSRGAEVGCRTTAITEERR